MAEIPPTRVTAQDGSFNQIPVFEWELSGGVLTKLSPTKIRLAISGSQGPSGPQGASGFTVPLIISSGGTGRTTAGSAHTILGVNSDGTTLTYYAILASNNATVTKVGTSIFISANSATPIVYAATGNKYVVLDLAADLTGEFRLVQSGNSITVTTAAGLVTINATTGDLSVKQDSISFPLIVGSGGTGTDNLLSFALLTGSGTNAVKPLTVMSHGALLVGSGAGVIPAFLNSGTVGQMLISTGGTTTGLAWVNSTAGAAGGGNGVVNAGSSGNLAYYAAAGTAVDDLLIGSAHTIVAVNSSGASHEYKALVGGTNVSLSFAGTAITISATTGGPGTGTVNAGCGGFIAYYPANGTTIDDSTISISTGNGVAPFNLAEILTSDAASVANGDFWFLSSSNSIWLKMRSGTTTYSVQLGVE